MTLNQIIGYRTILVNTGSDPFGSMGELDFALFDSWLTSSLCGGNTNRQVFMMDGDNAGEILDSWVNGTSFMTNVLGASRLCNDFNGEGAIPQCPPREEANCVRYLAAPGGAFGTSADVDAYGNGCPLKFGFDVLGAVGTGVGNRTYLADGGGGKQASYAQVVNEDLSPGGNYRTILTGVSLHHLTLRDAGSDHCPQENESIFSAIVSELGAALRWGFDVGDNASIPKLTDAHQLSQCEGTWNLPSDAENGASSEIFVNRLYANEPNPFNPRTTIRYSTAGVGPARIEIYDVEGRLVRTLVAAARMEAGPHEAVWDGTNDRGRRVGSGVYWAQMRAGSFTSNRKMIVIK